LGIRTGGAERNEAYLRELVSWGSSAEIDRAVLIDPQTSGGLLLAASPERAVQYLSRVPSAVEIGEVVPWSGLSMVVV
jgi:selenide,water dikinase